MQFKLNPFVLSAVLTSGLTLASVPHAQANGGHFLVDDADITPVGECALETWFQQLSAGSSEHALVAQGACTQAQGWEITLPVVYNTSDNELAGYGLELKTMLSDSWLGGALALSMGVMRDHQAGDFEGGFLNVPFSYELNDMVAVHINLGTEYNKLDSEWSTTWGFATTYTLHENLAVIGETAGVVGDKPTFAAGLRTALNQQVELDVSLGRDLELRGNIFTLGLNIAF